MEAYLIVWDLELRSQAEGTNLQQVLNQTMEV